MILHATMNELAFTRPVQHLWFGTWVNQPSQITFTVCFPQGLYLALKRKCIPDAQNQAHTDTSTVGLRFLQIHSNWPLGFPTYSNWHPWFMNSSSLLNNTKWILVWQPWQPPRAISAHHQKPWQLSSTSIGTVGWGETPSTWNGVLVENLLVLIKAIWVI